MCYKICHFDLHTGDDSEKRSHLNLSVQCPSTNKH